MPVKVTIFMSFGNYSWSESHYLIGASTFQSAIIPAAALASLRFACLGTYSTIIGTRLSSVPANRQVLDLTSNSWPAELTTAPSGGFDQQDEPIFTSLLLNFENTVANKNLYLAGIPDDVVNTTPGHTGSYFPTRSFSIALGAYAGTLVGIGSQGASWGFRSRMPQPSQTVLNVGTQAGFGNNMGLETAGNPGIAAGNEAYTLGFKTINPRVPNLSGAYRVLGVIPPGSGQPNWITVLNDTGNVEPSNFLTFGSIQPLMFQYLPYQNYHVVRVTHRKRGASYGAPRGRSRARR